jgi:hypothetical protein
MLNVPKFSVPSPFKMCQNLDFLVRRYVFHLATLFEIPPKWIGALINTVTDLVKHSMATVRSGSFTG